MLTRFAFAIVLVFATVFIHSGCTVATFHWFRTIRSDHLTLRTIEGRVATVAGVVFVMSLAAYLEVALWAAFYVSVGAIPRFGDALYFSLVTFTTLGYGDITLAEQWRTLAAFEAVNGIILFGWTTALIVGVVQRLFSTASQLHDPQEPRA